MRLSVPKPCHEDWNKMTLNEQGAFCKVCAKTVVDFSTMSDEEVLNYFKNKGEEKTCGRFKASQLVPYEFKVDIRVGVSLKFLLHRCLSSLPRCLFAKAIPDR